jgi:hypothetical protein
MYQNTVMFQEVSPAELRSVEGGRSWLGRAWDWVKQHVGIDGHYSSAKGGSGEVTVTVH